MKVLLERFNKLKPRQKGVVVLLLVSAVMVVIMTMVYVSSLQSARKEEVAKSSDLNQSGKIVNQDTHLMEQHSVLDAKAKASEAEQLLAEKTREIEELKKQKESSGQPGLDGSGLPMPQRFANAVLPPPPLPPSMSQPTALPPALPPGPPLPSAPAPVTSMEIGGISVSSFAPDASKAVAKAGDDDKKKDGKKTVYLPVSYMEATLLSGLDAPTSTEGKGNPVPVLIRVKTPAVLPNEVKANLKGCFVVADGKGNLGTERAELLLVSLSCLDRKGQAVIDQQISGYVVDNDGKAGLKGHVVSKMGQMIVRSMMAGLFGGVGDALKSSSTTTSVNALGTISDIKPENIGMAGLGSGLSNAFKDVQKFYMDLAHQTLPVIEIGAARPITLVVTRGVNLEIKKLRGGN